MEGVLTRGSLGSSVGWGLSSVCECLPVPYLILRWLVAVVEKDSLFVELVIGRGKSFGGGGGGSLSNDILGIGFSGAA